VRRKRRRRSGGGDVRRCGLYTEGEGKMWRGGG